MGKRKSSGTPARSRKRARQQPAVATDSARHNTSTVATEPIPEDIILCHVCANKGNDKSFLLCDACNGGMHMECAGLDSVPADFWACPVCRSYPTAESAIRQVLHAASPAGLSEYQLFSNARQLAESPWKENELMRALQQVRNPPDQGFDLEYLVVKTHGQYYLKRIVNVQPHKPSQVVSDSDDEPPNLPYTSPVAYAGLMQQPNSLQQSGSPDAADLIISQRDRQSTAAAPSPSYCGQRVMDSREQTTGARRSDSVDTGTVIRGQAISKGTAQNSKAQRSGSVGNVAATGSCKRAPAHTIPSVDSRQCCADSTRVCTPELPTNPRPDLQESDSHTGSQSHCQTALGRQQEASHAACGSPHISDAVRLCVCAGIMGASRHASLPPPVQLGLACAYLVMELRRAGEADSKNKVAETPPKLLAGKSDLAHMHGSKEDNEQQLETSGQDRMDADTDDGMQSLADQDTAEEMSRFKKAMKAISLNDVAISQQYRQMLDAVSWIASLSRHVAAFSMHLNNVSEVHAHQWMQQIVDRMQLLAVGNTLQPAMVKVFLKTYWESMPIQHV